MVRPNILLISADQQRADCFGFEGRRVRTPHLDRLARAGTRFSACITPCVVCQPARASMLTGQLPLTHGVHDNGIDLPPETGARGFAGALASAGYDTAFFGKAHFSTYNTFAPTGTPECVPSSASYPDDWSGPYMGFRHVELMLLTGHHQFIPETPPRGHHFERWFHADGAGADRLAAYRATGRDTRGAAQTWHSQLPVAWHSSTWIGDRVVERIRASPDDQPFLIWASFPDPHHPFDCPEPWSLLHDPATVDLPRHRTPDFTGRPWWHEAVLTGEPTGDPRAAAMRKSYSRIPPQGDDQLREIIANTYGQISLIDHQVGRMLNALWQSGRLQDTIIIYTSDHGDWLGDHGLLLKGPMHYEGVLRVPLIMAGPGVPGGLSVDAPASTLDLAPTLIDLAGATALLPQHGQSLLPLLAGGPGRGYALNEWELLPSRTGIALSLRTVRTADAKLTVDLRSGAGEMYDLAADPDETVNLFDDPGHRPLRQRLERLLQRRPDDAGGLRQQVGSA